MLKCYLDCTCSFGQVNNMMENKWTFLFIRCHSVVFEGVSSWLKASHLKLILTAWMSVSDNLLKIISLFDHTAQYCFFFFMGKTLTDRWIHQVLWTESFSQTIKLFCCFLIHQVPFIFGQSHCHSCIKFNQSAINIFWDLVTWRIKKQNKKTHTNPRNLIGGVQTHHGQLNVLPVIW